MAEQRGSDVEIRCGPLVEVEEEWIFEGVWTGPFAEGDFDRATAVFGSGVRCRDEKVVFVSSTSLVDRLWCYRNGSRLLIANSLPALLTKADDQLVPGKAYSDRHRNLPSAIGPPRLDFPCEDGCFAPIYYNNLLSTGDDIEVIEHPSGAPSFDTFDVYHEFLCRVAERIGANAASTDRKLVPEHVATVSAGYDSPAVAAIARKAGCSRAVTIDRARSVIPRSDSGRTVADALDMSCNAVPRAGKGESGELAFWAGLGDPQDLNLAAFPFEGEVTCLFSGAYGGRVWNKDAGMHPSIVSPVDPNMLGFSEFRLLEGCVHCALPFAGLERSLDLLRLSYADEMAPWSVVGDYDRPIPRRIAEEAGVPRGQFGQTKSATQYEVSFRWPYREDLQKSYRRHLRRLGYEDIPNVGLYRALNLVDRNLLLPLEERVNGFSTTLRERLRSPGRFIGTWAVNEMSRCLEQHESL